MTVNKIEKGLADTLLKEFKTEDLSSVLVKIGVLNFGEALLKYNDITAWQRGGAETFIASSEITTDKITRKFIAKAMVSMATAPELQLQNWANRRSIIEGLKIKTPILYSSQNGVIYEEFIDNDFKLNETTTQTVLEQLAFVAANLDNEGFVTLSFLSDLRIKDDTLYYVDFGSDLGQPSTKKSNSAISLLEKKATSNQLSFIRTIYDKLKTD